MPKSVVIIGGGISGLAAANELVKSGCTVTLLEAKDRFGGRMHTIHAQNLPIELGAEFVHGKSKPLLKAIRDAKLAVQEVPDSYQVFEDGKLKRAEIWEKVSKIMNRISPRGRDCSFREFVHKIKCDERTRETMLGFVEGFDAAYPERISAQALLKSERSAAKMEGDTSSRVRDGYAALVAYFEEQIRAGGGTLVKKATARRIRWKRGAVEVVIRRSGGDELFPAEAALVTLPIGAWKAGSLLFEPAVPEKQQAANAMQFGNVTKITLVFRKPWWTTGDFGFIMARGEAIPTWWSDPRGPMITGWAGGPKSDTLSTLSPNQLEKLSLQILERIFGTSGLRSKLLSSHTYNWADDPHIRGAYSYIPVNGIRLPKTLGAPVDGTLFFAGEATVTDGQMGTVFGALTSGLRAAREILKG